MRRISSAPTLRSVLAVALALLFYGLAIAVALLLFGKAVSEWTDEARPRKVRAVWSAFLAVLVLWTLWPRRERFRPPGPRLTRELHPALFTILEEIATATHQRIPDDVYLDPALNAWVREVESPGHKQGRRVLGIGLPLFLILSVPSLRAIIAHEFAHFSAGHDRDTLRFYRVERALVQTMNRTRFMGILSLPFLAYLGFFRSVTGAVSRRMEYEADRTAASLGGALPLATGLAVIEAKASSFAAFWWMHVFPVVYAGYRPPIVDGFRRLDRSSECQQEARTNLDAALQQRRAGITESHPTLVQRLTALNVDPVAAQDRMDGSSVELLGSLDGLEPELVIRFGRKDLLPIPWDAVGSIVALRNAVDEVTQRGKRLRGLTPRAFPVGKKLLRAVMPEWRSFGARETLDSEATSLLEAALILALRDKGWRVDWLPGESITCRRGGQELCPRGVISQVATGKLSGEEWIRMVEAAGIADADLGTVF